MFENGTRQVAAATGDGDAVLVELAASGVGG